MTFEEFFTKKRINVIKLEKAEPVLYTEFKTHFAAMGEKSFDHTKKFWFNKLRRLYHLPLPDKAVTQVETAIASQAEPLSSPTIEQKPAITPRFKSTNISKAELTEPPAETKSVAKPAFKPRNIPAKAPKLISDETTQTEPENNVPVKAPGFKPRNIKSVASENATDANLSDSLSGQPDVSETPIINPGKQEETVKEGYKPKFKLKNIPKNAASGEEQTGHPVKPELSPESLPEIQTNSSVEPDIKINISSSSEQKTPEQQIQNNNSDVREINPDEAERPKPAYKPKFNLKNIKQKE